MRLSEYGQTSTWQKIVTMLRDRATESYENSRRTHGVAGMHEDYEKVSGGSLIQQA